MAKLKVFGGEVFVAGQQRRVVLACASQVKAAELLGIPISQFRGWWSETGNQQEVDAALARPDQVLMHFAQPRGDLRAVTRRDGVWVEMAST